MGGPVLLCRVVSHCTRWLSTSRILTRELDPQREMAFVRIPGHPQELPLLGLLH